MELRPILPNVLVFLLCLGLVNGTNGDSCNVVSVDEDNNSSQSKSQPFWCQSQLVTDYPWTNNSSVTAPCPEEFIASVGLRKGSDGKKHICLKTEWKQKVSHLSKVKSYLLEVTQIEPHGDSLYYIVKFDESLSRHTAAYATFKYNCCGDPTNFAINPKDEYILKLQAMPIYRENDKQLSQNKRLVVSCNGKLKKSEECRRFKKEQKLDRKKEKRFRRKHKPPREPAELSEPSKIDDDGIYVAYYVLIVLGAIIIPFVLWLVYRIVKNKKIRTSLGQATPSNQRKILVVCSLRKRYIEVTNRIIDALNNCPSLSVISNVRSKVEIGKMGLVEWCEDSMNDAHVVVFLIADLDEILDQGDCDIMDSEKLLNKNETTTAITVAKNIAAKMNSDSKKKFLYVAMNKKACTNKLAFCHHYSMPKGWALLSKHLLSGCPESLEKTETKIIHSLLKIIELDSNSSSVQCDNREDTATLDNNQNDLDSPATEITDNTCTGALGSLNIIQDHPSIMSDASYVTTDLNNAPSIGSTGNYSHTGARPKV